MRSEFLKKISKSGLRIITALAVILGIPALVYLLWQPGSDEKLPEYANNAIWLGHGWLGDDTWFAVNGRDPDDFRSVEKISALFRQLSDHRISTVFPHLCPARGDGRIAAYDDEQIELFLDEAAKYHIQVIPWVGGVFGESARPSDDVWRGNFIGSIDELLKKHPRLAGVQINIEPWPEYEVGFLKLLDELRPLMAGKILSVAAYPPPTVWHRFPDVHWRLAYIHRLAGHCDQMVVMMYDTAIPLEKFYINLVSSWSDELVVSTRSGGCELLLGIPAYEDADSGYHHPQAENISAALRGISDSSHKDGIDGIAIYCHWEMDENKWRIWREFIQ